MTNYDRIYEVAVGNYGLISTEQARRAGVPVVEMAKLCHRGRLRHMGRGLYRLEKFPPAANDRDVYAAAVMRVGEGAYLYGPSVLALHGLCPTNPALMFVGCPTRCRKKFARGFTVVQNTPCDDAEYYEGIRSQSVCDAIRCSQGMIMRERLQGAIENGLRQGLLSQAESEELKGLFS